MFSLIPASIFSSEVHEYYLSDGWTFYWNHFFTKTPEYDIPGMERVSVPENWNHPRFGYGTYCCKVEGLDPEWKYAIFMNQSPGTAAAVYVNGMRCASCGIVSNVAAGSRACVKPLFVSFMPDDSGCADITFVVSNYVYRKAGVWSDVLFGRETEVRKKYNTRIFISAFISGMLMILFIVNGIIYLLNHERKDNLLFAAMAFLMVSRIITRKFSLLILLFPQFPYGIARKIEYLIIWAAAPVFLALIDKVYPHLHINEKKRKLITCVCSFVGCVCLILPIQISNYLVWPMGAITIASFIWVFWGLFEKMKDIYDRKRRSGFLSSGDIMARNEIVFLTITVLLIISGFVGEYVNIINSKMASFNALSALFFVFAICQFLAMSYQQSKLYDRGINKTIILKKLNDSYNKFVPVEFMKLLNKTDVTSVSLGDHVEKNMAILFMKTSSEMNMKTQFKRFSSFAFSAISIVGKRNGFVSKFNSEGLMALFPNGTFDAMQCARELSLCAVSCGFENSGVGVHYGKMIVGTIGEKGRLDDTVISDTVNTAFRLMEIAYSHLVPVVVSKEALDDLPESKRNSTRCTLMENIPVKGKKKTVKLFKLDIEEQL